MRWRLIGSNGGCGDLIQCFGHSQPLVCDKLIRPLICIGKLAGGGNSERRHAGS